MLFYQLLIFVLPEQAIIIRRIRLGNIALFKGIVSDSNDIILWHESEDIN